MDFSIGGATLFDIKSACKLMVGKKSVLIIDKSSVIAGHDFYEHTAMASGNDWRYSTILDRITNN
jgi:hypothetical protein